MDLQVLGNTILLGAEVISIMSVSQNAAVFLGNYIVKQDFNYDGDIIVDSSTVQRIFEEVPKSELEISDETGLLDCVNKLRVYFLDNDLKVGIDNFNNLNKFSVKRKPFSILLGLGGSYDAIKNELCYSSNKNKGHEVLHMFSSMYDNILSMYDPKYKVVLSGFSQTKTPISIGKGINEGYTELLASRIFNKNGKVYCYYKEVKIARLLELFFDEARDMANMYFNCDLPGLIHHLESFATRDEIIKFIQDVDCLYRYERSAIGPVPIIKSVGAQFTLFDWFVRKNNDPEKLRKFEEIMNEDKITSLLLKKRKMKLVKDNIYLDNLDDKNKVKKKNR